MNETFDMDIIAELKHNKLVNCITCRKRHLKKNSKSFPEIKTIFDGKKEKEINRILYFCSLNCELKYMINEHRYFGYPDTQIVEHLSVAHGYMYSDIKKNL